MPRCGSRRKSKATKGAKKTKKETIDASKLELDEDSKKILEALKKLGKPAKCGEIGKEIGLSAQKVAGKLRSLVNKGLVKKLEGGLYELAS